MVRRVHRGPGFPLGVALSPTHLSRHRDRHVMNRFLAFFTQSSIATRLAGWFVLIALIP